MWSDIADPSVLSKYFLEKICLIAQSQWSEPSLASNGAMLLEKKKKIYKRTFMKKGINIIQKNGI